MKKENLAVKIGDKVSLNYDVKVFDFNEFIDHPQSYAFKNIQLNFTQTSSYLETKNRDLLSHNVPIILFGYEEELLNITYENDQQIGYTKSFRIDLSEAIEVDEIKVNTASKEVQKFYQAYQLFISELIESNQLYGLGVMTKTERKNRLFDSFVWFYQTIFKEEIERIKEETKVRQSQLTDETFFRKSWNYYSRANLAKRSQSKINNITLIWSSPPQNLGWINQFVQEGIKRGLDQKANIQMTIGGQLYISRKRLGDYNKCQSTLRVSLSSQNLKGKSMYIAELWDHQMGTKKIEVVNLWQEIAFQNMLEIIINSPTY